MAASPLSLKVASRQLEQRRVVTSALSACADRAKQVTLFEVSIAQVPSKFLESQIQAGGKRQWKNLAHSQHKTTPSQERMLVKSSSAVLLGD